MPFETPGQTAQPDAQSRPPAPVVAPFQWTVKQEQALDLMAEGATHILLRGGGRSGKTFLIIRNIVLRALKAPNSLHCVLRFRFNHVRASIVNQTFPKVMKTCFEGVTYKLDRLDWFIRFENGSEIWFAGLDEKERTEKVLGLEFATLFLNECSQIPYSSVLIARTRMAQKVTQTDGTQLPLRMYYDENPPSKAHWSYKQFIQHRDPETNQQLTDRHRYATMQMNPADNRENLPTETIQEYMNMPGRMRKRFWEGEFGEVVDNALFPAEVMDRWRIAPQNTDEPLPTMRRVVIGVDPSGAGKAETRTAALTNSDAHATGIVVVGLGDDGNAYVIEDLTMTAPPAQWGKAIASAYDRHEADLVVGEINFGGAMVEQVIRAANPMMAYRSVRASRGKHLRAEPVSALMEHGKIRIVGYQRKLEDELEAFSTAGYMGDGSPNRADAMVHAVTELFPSITEKRRPESQGATPLRLVSGGHNAWMG